MEMEVELKSIANNTSSVATPLTMQQLQEDECPLSTAAQENVPFFRDEIDNDISSSPQLDLAVRFLYGLQGATMQLPSLALLAIVNDRVAIPPAYLPAYGAIAFLPHSLKPLYALLSSLSTTSSSFEQDRHTKMLLALLFTASGFAYVGTALLIPVGGVISCFVWGFLRGVTSAWSQFLLDKTLIRQAQDSTKETTPDGDSQHTIHEPNNQSMLSYQTISSLFQSQAATNRHLGSLVASIGIFAVFAWRQFQEERGDNPQLSDAVVLALLLGTAGICFAVALVVICHMIKPGSAFELSSYYTTTEPPSSNSTQRKRQPNQGTSISWCFSDYDTLSTRDDVFADSCGTDSSRLTSNDLRSSSTSNTTNGTLPPSPLAVPEDGPTQELSQRGPRSFGIRDRSDVASLVLLQLLLVGAALQRPIKAMTKGPAVWTACMTLLAICLVGAVQISSCHNSDHGKRQDLLSNDNNDSDNTSDHHAKRPTTATTIQPRRLGLYLMLRHSVPIASILMYSFIYTVFASEPLFLQCLFIIESAVSTFANWVYGRFLAKKYHSGWGVIGLIAVSSIVASLLSLLDVLVVHMANEKTTVDASLRWLVVFVSIVTYFMGQIGYMPSVILATANVVSSSDGNADSMDQAREGPDDRHQHYAGDGALSSEDNGASNTSYTEDERHSGVVYDEGIQYATFVACIDFGAQMGDWISVPIIAAYGITRANNWANLDRYIVLCALLRIASVSFLWIIRPTSRQIIRKRRPATASVRCTVGNLQ
jgi:hypothetical protein